MTRRGQVEVEERYQALRVAGIVERAGGKDPRFLTAESTRRYLDELEEGDGDQPQTITSDLQILTDAGLQIPSVFWAEHREVVMGGQNSR